MYAPMGAILDQKPTPRKAPLISINMWTMIIGQTISQLAVNVCSVLCRYEGPGIFDVEGAVGTGHQGLHHFRLDADLTSLKYVPSHPFSCSLRRLVIQPQQVSNHRLDNKFNILEGVRRNYFLIGIDAIMVGAFPSSSSVAKPSRGRWSRSAAGGGVERVTTST
jgi:P-type Ca2+ transporter type 2C